MISLLDNGSLETVNEALSEEEQLIALVYRFASKKDEWFNLLLSLSNCLSLSEELAHDHPYKDLSTRLLAHLKNAIKISTQLNSSEKHLQAESVLNHIPMGAAIINETGRIIEINQKAEQFFTSSDDWLLDQDYLSANHLRLCVEISPLTSSEHLSVITLPLESLETANPDKSPERKHRRKQLHITALPANDEVSEVCHHFYLCFQTQPEEIINTTHLKAHYQLTDTEALVVSTLVNEISSKKTASKLKLKEATIRDHLSSIYQKFEVSRKPELIRKVLLHKLVANLKETRQNTVQESEAHTLRETEFIYLRDGRRLSYLDHKPSHNNCCKRSTDNTSETLETQQTIVLLHNLMGSAKELPPGAHQLTDSLRVRFIVPERPGYGSSDSHPERKHKDWAKDLEELLDELKLDKVLVIAHSIGGPYALALAEFLPTRIERIAMVNAMPRMADIMSCDEIPTLVKAVNRSLRYAPFFIEPILKMAVGKDIEHFYEQQLNYIRPTQEGRAADINLLKTNQYRHYAVANLKQSAKQGVSIWADELKLSFAELDFSVENQNTEYQFWHGEHDDVIPIDAALNLSKELNTQTFKRMTYETHFLFARHFSDIVEQLMRPEENLINKDLVEHVDQI